MTVATVQPDSAAPAETQRPRPVVVYDGECRFCLKQVDRLRGRDEHEAFEFVPRQAEGLDERFPKLAEGDFDTGLRLVRTDGELVVGADAIYQIARQLRGYRRLAWLYRVPGLRGLLRLAYAWVAKNRYKLAGRNNCDDGSCKI
jgi:predicted DCC family thiol-disulfide oxidoreductase YuxK